VAIDQIALRGATAAVDEAKRKLKEQTLTLEFPYNPQAEQITGQEYWLDVFEFLRSNETIRQLGLTVESCKPQKIKVKVTRLVKRLLTVKCVDQSRMPLEELSIKPANIEMFVPEDWQGQKLMAEVMLDLAEIKLARVGPYSKKPFIELAPGQKREFPESVEIKLAPEAEQLKDYTITSATLGRCLSASLQGSYRIEVTNLEEVLRPISIKATDAARQAYELQPFRIILYILDDDSKTTSEQRRELAYNFPQDSVRKGEILLNQQPVVARFKLVPLNPTNPVTPD
jgi:hypothetical protein